ncbi:MAG: ribosomal subunit interface protein [Candidatus Liptonbacteria bacterium RIFCSPHIGHO2_01_FULL_57_28]|uniref:Ribosomal subunit interface protein n=1 Tax=Candidatus Liptonbacteria bacterium RIFCSPHIGHO2_01_FULL_57_28 TaxID=1798647 RepID=A0A1G2CDV4_9BACT|nr:MAG: ribosomal subunit interface protein [Candidatus Liptonbacteria bacterium RIFCSPHIGHO2_01_FULL_57_28]
MKIEISSKNMELLPSLVEYVNEKLGSLDRHVQKYEQKGELTLRVRIGRITAHHQKGEVFEASAYLDLPGPNIHVEKTSEDMHTAIDMARAALAQEIEKHKEKRGDKRS